MKRIAIASILSFLVSFAFGMLMFVLYYDNLTKEMVAAHPNCMNAEPNMAIGLSVGLIISIFMSICFDRMKFDDLKKGALNGLWFSGFFWLAANLNQVVIFSVMDLDIVFKDTLISIVWGGISGAPVGWALGKFKD